MAKVVFESDVQIVTLGADGIPRVVVKSGMNMTLEEARESINVCQGKQGVFVDLREMKSITAEARSAFSNAEGMAGAALFTASPVSRTIANFFIMVNKSKIPVRMFTDESEAMAWLKSIPE